MTCHAVSYYVRAVTVSSQVSSPLYSLNRGQGCSKDLCFNSKCAILVALVTARYKVNQDMSNVGRSVQPWMILCRQTQVERCQTGLYKFTWQTNPPPSSFILYHLGAYNKLSPIPTFSNNSTANNRQWVNSDPTEQCQSSIDVTVPM
jgi:hypothetical protein